MFYTRSFAFIILSSFTLDIIRAGETTGNMADPEEYSSDASTDLTKITWAHAVNSKQKLQETLKGKSMMIEADVVLGYLKGQSTSNTLPIMAHPPKTSSDLSLKEFLEIVSNSHTDKGIKLDFKSRDAFSASESVLDDFFLKQDATFPFWLNADIVYGPVNCKTKPVDADYFLSTSVTKYPQATLSVGWTTCYGNGIDSGSYTPEYIANMTEALNRNAVVQPVTFAVRAGLAAQSYQSLRNLISSSIYGTTLTIWSSSENDYINIADLRKLINDIGKDKIYLDLPDDIAQKVQSGTTSLTGNIPITVLLSLFMISRLL